ncbi:Adenosylmethionine-8-amino-7-oxononanoate aminotransferase [Vibrio aerogenes CECT 7868]|uniref:Adenosylmethionine-8-amino-7-oxononanoate aminotransferase n=1 Tax=Vibrio aerogenes CECT 7868 TaxID=1216006 RepID=A0A1M6EM56_9VIBR|nr:Adenosylmethionine-8-amino-7-oxononanoate aminotransferase [Vibrio aerogenes CECT 7868]
MEFDRNHIWHPYTSTINPLTCYPVTKAFENKICLESGETLIDGMSSWWSAIHGYNHPALNAAASAQLEKMSHVMFGGLTHEPAVSLCKQLVALTPPSLSQVFLADSGSVAVEVALKMAMQYWHSRGEKRPHFLTLSHGYHGDTFAAMSVTDPDNSMHKIYKGFLPEHFFASSPQTGFREAWDPDDLNDFRARLEKHHTTIAAVILEPIVQGAGGMRIYHPQFLSEVRKLCDEFGILLILDEIATGFGRTGKLFASEHAGIEPDILCIGKALTGGYMTLSATLTTQHIARTVCEGEAQCFMHGPTFMGNPLACAVASASMNLIQQGDWKTQVKNIEAFFSRSLPALKQYTMVKEVRWLGAIGVVETVRPVNMEKIQALFVRHGVWIRPFGKLIYMMPPYMTPAEDLSRLIHAVEMALQQPDCFIQ